MSGARPLVALARRLPAAVERELAERFELRVTNDDRKLDEAALIAWARDADALVPCVTDRVGARVLESATRLRIVANFGAGTDNLDLDAARRLGLVVTNTPGALTDDTADVAIYLMLAAMRRTGDAERELRAGEWSGWRPNHIFGETLRGKLLGVVGFGRIGRAVAERACAFGMRVRYATRTPIDVDPSLATPASSLDALFAECDVISLHTPATAETQQMVDARRLALVRPTAILINTARGALVDESALIDSLRSRRLGGAGLDVFEREPSISTELMALENVVLLPHIGSATRETREAMGRMVIANLRAFFDGSEPPNRVV